mgnify:CR=1 FL=1
MTNPYSIPAVCPHCGPDDGDVVPVVHFVHTEIGGEDQWDYDWIDCYAKCTTCGWTSPTQYNPDVDLRPPSAFCATDGA